MTPSLEFLERCSAETGYQLSSLEKVVRLGEMAGDMPGILFLVKFWHSKEAVHSTSVIPNESRQNEEV